ncbi:MAG: SAM-dependent chlorinase/fluorinase [Bacteroidetes bacterium]|nr:SAM-dependent chlorinase/fluorinase [Bacteroidota bacterium]
MPVVTFTSDLGLQDYYVAMIKGAILCKKKGLNIVDVTHQIPHYDIVQGAFVLKNTWTSFPKGSIHLISVNNFYGKKNTFLAIRHEGHYFIGPDNGLFSLLFDSLPKDIYELPFKVKSNFPLKEVFASAVGYIANEKPFNEIGIPIESIEKRITLQPVISPSQIRGSVIHIDNYENVILNISQPLFERIANGRLFSLFFKRHNPIKKLSKNYSDVPVGETLCLFNSAGLLEIAINMGKAAGLLGLKKDDTVQIDFHNPSTV